MNEFILLKNIFAMSLLAAEQRGICEQILYYSPQAAGNLPNLLVRRSGTRGRIKRVTTTNWPNI
jgi:hypothetical protein